MLCELTETLHKLCLHKIYTPGNQVKLPYFTQCYFQGDLSGEHRFLDLKTAGFTIKDDLLETRKNFAWLSR